MAVRDDFAAGEVLAAADLNDTFASKADYPSGGSNGDLLTKSGTTTAWAAPSVAGLTLIANESFSAVSSVSINNCFTATYSSYRVLFSANGATTGRLRASGVDATGSDYVNQYLAGASTTVSAGRSTTTSFDLNLGSGFRLGVLDIHGPALAQVTYQSFVTSANVASLELAILAGAHNVTTAYDGFTLLGSNITGNLRVYGYKD